MASKQDGAGLGIKRLRNAKDREKREFEARLSLFPHTFQLKDLETVSDNPLKSIRNHLQEALKAGYPTVLEEVRTRNLLAFVLCRLQEKGKALEQLERAMALEGQHVNIVSLANKAVILLVTGRKREAEQQVKLLHELQEHHDFSYLVVKAKAELAATYLRFGHKFIGLAIESFREVIRDGREPELSMWKFGLAVAYRQSLHLQCLPHLPDQTEPDRHETAMNLLLEVVRATPDSPNLRANAHAEIGLLISATWEDDTKQQLCTLAKSSAVKSVKKAFELDREDASVLLKRGRLFRYARNLRDSVNSLQKSVELQPSSQAYHHLGLTYKAMATNVKRGKPATRRGGKRNQRRKQAIANRRSQEAKHGTVRERGWCAPSPEGAEKTNTTDATKADGASEPMECQDMVELKQPNTTKRQDLRDTNKQVSVSHKGAACVQSEFDKREFAATGQTTAKAEPMELGEAAWAEISRSEATEVKTASTVKHGQGARPKENRCVRQNGSATHCPLTKGDKKNQQGAQKTQTGKGETAHRVPGLGSFARPDVNTHEGCPTYVSSSFEGTLDSGFSSMYNSEEHDTPLLDAMVVHDHGDEETVVGGECTDTDMMDEEELVGYGKADLVIDMAELQNTAVEDEAGATSDSRMLRRLMRAIKSPPNKNVTKFSAEDKFVAEAIQQLKKAVEFSEKENTRAMYDLGLLYKALNQNENALAVFEEIFNRGDPDGPLDVIGAYEQSGLILLEQIEACEDEEAKRDLQANAEDMLNKALQASFHLYSRLPLVGGETTRVWHSVATLLKLVEQNDNGDLQKLKDKLNILKLTRNPRQILPLVRELKKTADQTEDMDGFRLCIESLVHTQLYESAIPIIETLLDKSQDLDPTLVATVYIKAGERNLLRNTQAAAEDAKQHFSAAFKEMITRAGEGFDSEGAGTTDSESMSSDQEGGSMQDSWNVMLLHQEGAEEAAQRLARLLGARCGLRVTRMDEDVRPGRPANGEMGRVMINSEVIVILLGGGRQISPELKMYLSAAASRPRVFVLTLENDCRIPSALKSVEGKERVRPFPNALGTDFETGSITREMASAIVWLLWFIGGVSSPPP